LCFPTFASSWIGQSGDVRYDKFFGSSTIIFYGRAFSPITYFTFCSRSYILFLSRDSFRVTCPISLVCPNKPYIFPLRFVRCLLFGVTDTRTGKLPNLLTTDPKRVVKGIRRPSTTVGNQEGCTGATAPPHHRFAGVTIH
jgi:hypothetical protein